jgi:hypothetical protein
MSKKKEELMARLPKNFYWKTYLKLNKDLNQNIQKWDAINHYLEHGIIEGRQYCIFFPKNFNWEAYIYLNPDLRGLTSKTDCVSHYLKEGYFENRKYEILLPDDFNWEYYLENNKELKNDIKSEEMAIKHYLKKGFFQNRIYSKIIDPTKELFDLPKYYLNEKYDNNNLVIYKDDLLFDQLHEHEILQTIQFCKNLDINTSFLKYSVDEEVLNKLKSFVLVIDFYNGGGGTTFFLNTIISKYKKKSNICNCKKY